MPGPLSARPKLKVAIAISLSWGAGVIDVLGYLTLHKTFVANMTGNTVTSVVHGFVHNWPELFHRGTPIPCFFFGLLAGEITLESARRRCAGRGAARALGIEAFCLAAFLAFGLLIFGPTPHIHAPKPAPFVLLVGLISIAMGVQSAALRKVGALTIFTTFITGTLTKLANDLSRYLFWLRDRTRGRFTRRIGIALRLSPRQRSFQAVVLLVSLYLAYGTGAWAGVEGFHRCGVAVSAAPLVLVLAAIVIDLVRPMTLESDRSKD